MRRWISFVAVLTAALAAAFVIARTAPHADLSANGEAEQGASGDSNGKPIVTNGLDGKPILTVANLLPGQSRSGQVVLKNAGSAPETVSLWQSGLTSGPAGRPNLAAWAQLAVHDGALGKNLYVGPFKDFATPSRPMLLCGLAVKKNDPCSRWAKGETHVFTFTVTFPDVPAGSDVNLNTYQSTWLRSEFDWASVI